MVLADAPVSHKFSACMKKKLLISVLFLSLITHAQNVSIKGHAKTYAKEEIGLWVYNDRISNTQKELSYTDIDSAGNFALQFTIKSIQYVTLKIGKHIASMYVQPDAAYDVIIEAPDSTTYQNPNIEQDVKISIRLDSKTGINALTMDYDKRFDDFLTVNYNDFLRRTPQPKIDSFRLAMISFYSTVTNPYFNNYITYSIAALEKNTKMSEKKLYERYLMNKPVLYDHPEYMNFFNSFYKQRLQNFALSKAGNDMPFIMNDRASYPAAVNALRRAGDIPNDTIAELVLLKGLYETYYDGSFKKSAIKAILQQMAAESRIAEHQKIAQNILSSFSPLQKGTMAPAFELPDKTGQTHSLDELRTKKFVYIMFFDDDCSACMEQMKVIPALKKTYGEQITFTGISTDKTNTELKNFQLKNPKYDWLFLYDNTGAQLKKNYEIVSLPAYFLVGPDGKFIQVPANSPDEDIEQTFYDLTKVKSKLHGVGNKQNQKQ
jgi:peroxiredoxin